MSRHARLETVGVSPKVVVTGAVTTLLSVLVGILNSVNDSNLIPLLPEPWQTIVLIVLPPVLVVLGGYGAGPGMIAVKTDHSSALLGNDPPTGNLSMGPEDA